MTTHGAKHVPHAYAAIQGKLAALGAHARPWTPASACGMGSAIARQAEACLAAGPQAHCVTRISIYENRVGVRSGILSKNCLDIGVHLRPRPPQPARA